MPGKSGSEILVSIVIPCYNPTHFLRETVDSVLAQTHQPTEVIMVNDGTDQPDASELLRSLAPRVTRCIDQANLGLAAARNTGFRAANGQYVLPLDADDRLAPSFVADCVAALQAHPEAAFVYTDYRVFGDARYVERLGDYNLYGLLDRNTIVYAGLVRVPTGNWLAGTTNPCVSTMRTGIFGCAWASGNALDTISRGYFSTTRRAAGLCSLWRENTTRN